LLIVVVFLGVFVVAALLLVASGSRRAETTKQTLAHLDAVLVSGKESHVVDELVDIRKKEMFSSIPLLNRLLLKLEASMQLRRILYQANINWTPSKLLLTCLATWLATGQLVYFRTSQILPAVLVGLLAGMAPFGFVLVKRARQFAKFEEGLPAALDLMVSALRSGHSVTSAIGMVSRESPDPIGREFRACFEEQNYGLELRTALESMAVRVPLQDVRIMMTAILVQKETGGNLAEVLEKCAQLIRERFRLKREIGVRTAQGRLTGWILSLLPPGLGVLLYFLQPEMISLLWKREEGIKLMYMSGIMTTIGALLIRKIVRIRV
jgi:tight adherence protein B